MCTATRRHRLCLLGDVWRCGVQQQPFHRDERGNFIPPFRCGIDPVRRRVNPRERTFRYFSFLLFFFFNFCFDFANVPMRCQSLAKCCSAKIFTRCRPIHAELSWRWANLHSATTVPCQAISTKHFPAQTSAAPATSTNAPAGVTTAACRCIWQVALCVFWQTAFDCGRACCLCWSGRS